MLSLGLINDARRRLTWVGKEQKESFEGGEGLAEAFWSPPSLLKAWFPSGHLIPVAGERGKKGILPQKVVHKRRQKIANDLDNKLFKGDIFNK